MFRKNAVQLKWKECNSVEHDNMCKPLFFLLLCHIPSQIYVLYIWLLCCPMNIKCLFCVFVVILSVSFVSLILCIIENGSKTDSMIFADKPIRDAESGAISTSMGILYAYPHT